MYNSFFGLDADPFRVNPDPRFLYLSESHREALATLVYAVRERKGFIALTGEVGTGKTTIMNALLGRLGPKTQTAYIFNTALSVEDFFMSLFDELELPQIEPFRKSAALHALNEYLIRRLKAGEQTLLLVDEAQNLSTELLEEIRMLSNLETPTSKLLQIILVGQPELSETLARPELRQLRQRIELRHTIRALDARETAEYVRERLMIAGHETGKIFTTGALASVHRASGGIPRIVNVICDNALLTAFARGSQRVQASGVQEAARELGYSEAQTVRREEKMILRGDAGTQGWFARLFRRRAAQAECGA